MLTPLRLAACSAPRPVGTRRRGGQASAELGNWHDRPQAIGTRDTADTAGREEYAAWAAEHAGCAARDLRRAPRQPPSWWSTRPAATSRSAILESAGADNLAGKVLLDISNPLDGSKGFPPTLFVKDDDSLAEMIQRAHPRARVVKSLNTMNNALMADPQRLGEDTTVFVSGDDADAKARSPSCSTRSATAT